MSKRESTEAILSAATAAVCDGLSIYAGFCAALWIRFKTDLVPLFNPPPTRAHALYISLVATLVFIISFRFNELYKRPQSGRFEDKIPRLIKSILYGFLFYIAFEAIMRLDPPYSRPALFIAFFTVSFFVLLERYVLYRIEWNLARHLEKINRVIILGTDAVSLRVAEAFRKEPFLRSEVMGYLTTSGAPPHPDIAAAAIRGSVDDMESIMQEHQINQVILTDTSLSHERMVDLIVVCEKNYARFKLVPDLWRILTSDFSLQTLGGIPVMGLSKWPLDFFLNRTRKRLFDIGGAAFGLLIASPIIACAALAIKRSSPGPVFYKQTRYGENGQPFEMYKLRTMGVDAEADNEPGWTKENDPRITPAGAFLRKYNIDELPQFLNVLKGEMSLVGPRPERPFYVDHFKEVINRYMVRHVSLPGMTGWAQVNGLRGDTSIDERIKYDLYYLENWSLAFDFKILVKTFLTNKNAC